MKPTSIVYLDNSIIYLFIIIIALCSFNTFAQPVNDLVCNATNIVVDGASVTSIPDSANAVVEVGEQDIAPVYDASCENGWCDGPGPDNGVIHSSLWYTFVAPSSTAVTIDICGSNYDTQLALYEVGICSDFSTFTSIVASDDLVGCGPAGFSSSLTIECLTPGTTYYVLVDGWQGAGTPVDSVVIFIQTAIATSPSVSVDSFNVTNPSCPVAVDGSIELFTFTGQRPFQFAWSNDSTTQNLSGLSDGTYTVTVTDFCGTTTTENYLLLSPAPLPILYNNVYLSEPSTCGNDTIAGQLILEMNPAGGPFTFNWSNGSTSGFLGGLSNGSYFVTITNFADCSTLLDTFNVGATAGPDQDVCNIPVQLGNSNMPIGGMVQAATYNVDQAITRGIVACRGGGIIAQNSFFRAFDLHDFGLTGIVDLRAIEVFLLNIQGGPNNPGSVPIEMALHMTDTLDLTAATLNEKQRVIINMPNTIGLTPWILPLSGLIDTDSILVVEISLNVSTAEGNLFDMGVNETAAAQPTYISSVDCGISPPLPYPAIGFADEIVMNLFFDQGTGFSYSWSGPPVSNSAIANPMATLPGTYVMQATDITCGTILLDTVVIPVHPGDDSVNAHLVTLPFNSIDRTDKCYSNQYLGTTSKDVFYTFNTGSYQGPLLVSTCSDTTAFDTYIYLLDSALNVIAFNDDSPIGSCGSTLNGLNRFSLLTENVSSNSTYFVVVEGFLAGDEGVFEVFIEPYCPTLLTLNGAINSGRYQAETIVSDGVIPTPNVVDFRASIGIDLNTPFEVGLGAEFNASAGGCP